MASSKVITLFPSSHTNASIYRSTADHSHLSHRKFSIPRDLSVKVTRRKSVSSNVSNVAAIVAAAKEAGDNPLAMPISTRRATMSKNVSRPGPMGSLPSPPSSLPTHRIRLNLMAKLGGESAIDDDNNDEEMDENEEDDLTESGMRGMREGSQLLKDGKKANANDLRWEHTPEWSYTSKLLISKHQQVQLLEAASVLVGMNQDAADTPPDSAKDFQSDDQDSASPAASGSDDHENDRASSADTSPPPADMRLAYGSGSYNRPKRYIGHSALYGLSDRLPYGGSVPATFGHSCHQSHERRPPSSGMNGSQGTEGLTAGIESLTCGLASPGTPRSGPLIPEDAPPVPEIPAQYLTDLSTSFTPSLHPRQRESFARESYTRGSYDRHQIHGYEDVQMEDGYDSVADEDDYDQHSRCRSDEDDDGVFGLMEE
ncbi:hypothetical protein SBOR_2709 [Sclerotinia borealis F-4128]|uniref:Uncharacterized protein n=1 Tax=Sclerotinia borealis (strain F-4128) TaxID=1432307 RepID=W9CR14_SCLBF|nr:hypothetical protein SBOR_2709 [Sclerotinia borealis F-4128]